MLRFSHRRAVERILHLLRTAGAEPRLMFATCADSTLRQAISDAIGTEGAIQQIPAVITPGEPVPKGIREHKGTHANTKLFVLEGLSEAVGRGGQGFFELLSKNAGYYTNYGTWALVWITDAESRVRLEREAPRLFQGAIYSPTFFTASLIEKNPGALPELAAPSPLAGDPDGRVATLAAKIRRRAEAGDMVDLGEELSRLGDLAEAKALFAAAAAPDSGADAPTAARALRGLYRLKGATLEAVGHAADSARGAAAVEARLIVAGVLDEAGEAAAAESALTAAVGAARELGDPALTRRALVHAARFLRRRERLDEAASLLWDSGLLPSPEIRRPSTPEAQAESDAGPILAEWGRLELERALNQEGADPAARVDIARRYLEKARAVALTARPEDPEAAHQADTYLAGLHFARGDAAEALAVLEKAIRRAESSGMRALAVDGYRLRMSARFELGENSSAMGDLLSAVKLAKTIGYPDLEAEVLAEQAGVEEKLGNREKATRLKVEAEQLRQLR